MDGIKRGAIRLVAICLVFLGSTVYATEKSLADFETAACLLTSGNYKEALDLYQAIADQAQVPDTSAQALLLKAVAISQYLNKPDMAMALLNQIEVNYPGSRVSPDVLFHKGMLYYGQQNYNSAAATFSQYISQYPDGIRRHSAESWRESATARTKIAAPDSALDLSTFRRDEEIRVLISEGAERLELGAAGRVTVRNAGSGSLLYQGKSPVVFTRNRGNLILNGQKIAPLKCRVETTSEPLSLKDMRLRGFLIVALEPDGLQAINHVPIEAYLLGIISKEMPASWSGNALKAQAVASRTYALYIKSKNRFMPFDVEATTESQVYGGYNAETVSTNAAVNATRGQVITRNNQLIIPYFHSNSAGHTEEARYVWQVDLPYLKGVADPFSKSLPNSSWQYTLPYAVATSRLNQAGLKMGFIKSIKPNSHTPSGRVFDIAIETDTGRVVVSANHFRCLLDAKQIKSTFFKIMPQPAGVILEGYGQGHGVGMSQWGANQMATSGHSYQEILKHYYSGVELSTLSST
ncbi:MAG: SpoIID/LytB domain-containing protein [Pseudomonadota bacterium]